ncbi:26891_t:CDS:2 [Gigaspora margarita]|uniref:26891_t:CDS:1 n=1 Tax=Gigaspora margarita TaxID=4874 RepID=A0ABN7V2L9_GIGMA|nr:26891_t:CDS:2 [Gigaspora margarita]
MNLEIEEDSSYLSSSIIVYKEKRNNIIQRSFYYEIIEERVYFNALQSAYTSISKERKYKITNQYSVKTTIGRNKKKTIYCFINYKNNKPIFHISYGENFEYKLSSTSSSLAINPNSKTKWPGTLIFGLQLESAKKFGSQARELLESTSQNYYSKDDDISIKAIDYSINNYNFHIDFEKEDLIKTKQHQLAIVQALDKAKVLQDSTISSKRILLNKQMEANIKIMQVNLDCLEVEKDSADTDTDFEIEEEMIDVNDTVKIDGIGAQHSIKDFLNYIIPYLEQSNILKCDDPVVHLRILGDSRNVGYKIKHHENTQADWRITKTMDQLKSNWNNTNGHINAPLFDMIPLENWICDKLHILLRIFDRLWILVISEIKTRGLFNDISRKIIVDEIKRIGISFQFWEDNESHIWKYTSLIGKDKLKVLRLFNLEVLFRPSRAKLICQLWDQFDTLYQAFRNQETDPLQFKKNALSWLNLFLTPSISTNSNNTINAECNLRTKLLTLTAVALKMKSIYLYSKSVLPIPEVILEMIYNMTIK